MTNDVTKRTRLSRPERRKQLLTIARVLISARGADGLTLVSLAESAGVTRPVVYDQFQTRSGLLIALYDQISERQFSILREQLASAKPAFCSIAEAASQAYMRCYATVGPEAFAIVAALKGDEEMDQFFHLLLRRYVNAYADALQPYTSLGRRELEVHCTAIVGAAEALSNLMVKGDIEEAEAATTLLSLITSWLGKR
jgi:AcrR family transcriptional regulator